jgi:hypothetical protein
LLTSYRGKPPTIRQISIVTPSSGRENISLPYLGRVVYGH